MTARNNDACLKTISSEEERLQAEKVRTSQIRALNDRLRRTGCGGKVLITDGILALGAGFARQALEAVSGFDTFTADNDPWGEHDCAVLTVANEKVIWKIDYYDRSLTFHSPDPANGKVTIRVLTIMLAGEY
jgi:hypothetical protein